MVVDVTHTFLDGFNTGHNKLIITTHLPAQVIANADIVTESQWPDKLISAVLDGRDITHTFLDSPNTGLRKLT